VHSGKFYSYGVGTLFKIKKIAKLLARLNSCKQSFIILLAASSVSSYLKAGIAKKGRSKTIAGTFYKIKVEPSYFT